MNDTVRAYLDAHSGAAAGLPGGAIPWVRQVREQGLARFSEVGFPTTRDEDWKYTSLRAIEKHRFIPAPDRPSGLTSGDLTALDIPGLDAHRCVFVNGRFAPALSSLDRLPAGLTVTGLADALNERADELEPQLGRLTPHNPNGLIALNSAFLADGAYVRVARGCAVDRPLELVYLVHANGQALALHPRSLIIVEPGAEAVILERYISTGDGDRYLNNTTTEILVMESARVDYYKLQDESPKAYHFGGLFVHQDSDTVVSTNNIAVGGSLARTDLAVSFNAPGAHSTLNGLYIGTGRQHLDNHTQVDHRFPECVSDEFYKGILDVRARGVFHGRIVVHQDAQRTEAQQQNKNLLLSRQAEVDTKPQLEIYADDVKCSHGATVGQLDANAVFYLRSRAVAESIARSLLTYAFANDVINRFALAPIRQQLEQHLAAKLLPADQGEVGM